MKNKNKLIRDIQRAGLLTGVAGFFMSGAIMFLFMAFLMKIGWTSFCIAVILSLLFDYGADRMIIKISNNIDNNEYN